MNSKRAYKSFIGRVANKERMKKYNTSKIKEKEAAAGGLLSRKTSDMSKEDNEDMDAVMMKYMKIVRELAGGSNAE